MLPRTLYHYSISYIIKILLTVSAVFLSGNISSSSVLFPRSLSHTSNHTADSVKIFSVYLIGDAGYASLNPLSPTLSSLKHKLRNAGSNSAVIFLGDNIYPNGLPRKIAATYQQATKRLDAQLKSVEDYQGKIFFIPGNHDWRTSGRKGWQAVKRQERYVESKLDRGNTFLPDSGKPGPTKIRLTVPSSRPDTTYSFHLITLNTQWWLHPHKKPYARTENREVNQRKKAIKRLDSMLARHEQVPTVIAGHHPIYSNGRHGGKFQFKRHLLPPVFGSLYVIYRKIWGVPQDITHQRYQVYEDALNAVLQKHTGLIYASGHDHNLQYILKHPGKDSSLHYIISGAGSEARFVKEGGDAQFTKETRGFAGIQFFSNGTRVLTFWNRYGDKIYETILK